EPWLALAPHAGAAAARALLTAAWRTLLHAHPHDTLCGTSIDAVADAFDARLASVEQQGAGLREDALLELVAHDRDAARAAPESWRPAVLLRNPAARPRGGVVELSLAATLADVAVGPGSATRQGARRSRPPWRVKGMIVQVLARRERVMLTESPRAYPDADLVAEVDAVGWATTMAGYSVEARPQAGRNEPALPHPVVVEDNTLDNGLVRIEVSASGEVSLWDRARDRRVNNVLSLERRRDVGDSYTPALRDALDVGRPRRVRVLHRGPIRGAIAIEYASRARDAGVGGVCTLVVSLDADSHAVRVHVRGENRARDHRLRLRVATAIAGPVTLADAAFLPVVREALDLPPAERSMEHVVPTAPLHRWVAHLGASGSAAIASDGLAEYESAEEGALFITLVRAIGQLSRHDLPERPGHAGWPAETPGAQCIGPYEASIALQLFDADSPSVRDAIAQFAEDMLLPITGETLRSNLRDPVRAGRIELSGDGLAFSAAAPARRAGWIVLRCVNRRETSERGAWQLHSTIAEAVRARLDETEGVPLVANGPLVEFVAAGHEIVTILVRVVEPT
ncbi:MAG: glycoside hydrolase family 38 C-terminal domain-containing protein, partial [bacterium]